MEGGERILQLHPGEYDYLVPDLMQSTQGRYIFILPVVVVMLILYGKNNYRVIYYWLVLARRLL